MSTSRYTNAGGIGTGTVTDNMQSRAKAWSIAQTSQATTTLTFNVSGIVDSNVGYWTHNYIAPLVSTMNPCPSSVANIAYLACSYSTATAAIPQIVNSSTQVRTDEWINFATFGALA